MNTAELLINMPHTSFIILQGLCSVPHVPQHLCGGEQTSDVPGISPESSQ